MAHTSLSHAIKVRLQNLDRLSRMSQHTGPLVYGLGTLGLTIPGEAFGAFVYFYYIDVLGLSLGLAAVVRTVYAIWDALNDPIFGYLSDNTRTRWGRRRPWLVLGLPGYLLCFVLVFAVPAAMRGAALFWYALVTLCLFETLSTVIRTNYAALFPERFTTLPDRIHASAFNRVGVLVGLLVGLAVTPLVYRQLAFQGMALLYAVLGGSLLALAVARQTEDPAAGTLAVSSPRATLGPILRERTFWLYALTLTLISFAFTLFPLAIPFYTKYALRAPEDTTSVLFGVSLLAALASVPLWVRLLRRWGTSRVFLRALGVMVAACCALGLAPNVPAAVAATVVYGLGWSGCHVCFDVIRSELMDQHFERSGQRSEGAYYSLLGVGIHLSGVFHAVAMVLIGVMFGYVSGEQPGLRPDAAFRVLLGVFPAVGLLLACVLARRFFAAITQRPAPRRAGP